MKLPSFLISVVHRQAGMRGHLVIALRASGHALHGLLGAHVHLHARPGQGHGQTTKTNTVRKKGMALDLDVHDLLHDAVADQLQRHRASPA